VIDLSRVTTLSSAGTRVLDAVRELAAGTGIELEIVSDPGTVGERYAMAGQSPTT
jgi:anti-anti-sigma regulatory factor